MNRPGESESDRKRRLEAERKRRLDRIFGEVLPEQTRDDTAPEGRSDDAAEEWLRRQVPPHHG
ncbi:MAG TPA: hypothetical protein VFM09_06485 [Marmoricola sp.]|nr:hypothetical protein [Marmoricola sp.]